MFVAGVVQGEFSKPHFPLLQQNKYQINFDKCRILQAQVLATG